MNLRGKMKSISLICGNVIFAFSQFVILSMITKNYDKISLGYFTLSISLTAPIFMFFQMNYRTIYATSLRDEISFKKIKTLNLLQSFIALGISLIITYIFYKNLSLMIITFNIGISKIVEGIQEISYGYYQKRKKINSIALSKGLRGVLAILICYLLVYKLKANFIYASLSYFIAWSITLVFFDSHNVKDKEMICKNEKSYLDIIKQGFPLGVTVFLDSLIVNSPRYYVSIFLGFQEVAYFSSLLYFMNLGQIVVTSITQTYISELSSSIDTNFNKYLELKKKLIVMSLLIGIIIIIFPVLFSDFILPIVFDKSFIQYKNEFVLIMVAAAIWYLAGIYHTCILATRRFTKQSIIFIITFIVMQLFLLIFVPVFGLIGACISLVLSYLVRLFISMYMLRKIEKEIC